MKKIYHSALILAAVAVPAAGTAQSAIDAYNLSQTELRGTARFMSMAGAFTALGGDLSTLGQNPAGIGVYRGNDIGLTASLTFASNSSSGIPGSASQNNTHFDVNNFGYVGTLNISNPVMQTFSWGLTYNRLNSFSRNYRGSRIPLETSMSNYVALMTDGISPDKMKFYDNYDPYQDSDINWLSILGFSGGISNPETITDSQGNSEIIYNGLFQYAVPGSNGNPGIPATTGTADFTVQERGYTDEYNIDFGGNLANVVYWGLGFGITDINRESWTTYTETLQGANVPLNSDQYGIEEGNCDWELDNWKKTTGTGFNVKLGLIFKPVNELRIGLAVHTPTWYSLTTSYQGNISFGANNGYQAQDYTNLATYSWNMRSPWRMMAGIAGVIGGRGILSLDYEYTGTDRMHTSDAYGDFSLYNDDIKDYFRSSNTIRLGGEFRVTPQFSIRAGYAFTSSNVKDEYYDNNYEVYTSGTDLGYTFNKTTNSVTAGVGYRTGGFYVDLAYVYSHRESKYNCFTHFKDYDGYWTAAPGATIAQNTNQLALTLGYKF
ncbi:MAG: hypothetical protein HDS68_10170 [Bacteroidales bacterium]|nr:hypothetical protein [Bacteroidales bacterium]